MGSPPDTLIRNVHGEQSLISLSFLFLSFGGNNTRRPIQILNPCSILRMEEFLVPISFPELMEIGNLCEENLIVQSLSMRFSKPIVDTNFNVLFIKTAQI